jgi:(S)-2-hydroxyglutarate dehydrogenase
MKKHHLAIIGGGIVGLATARAYQQRFPGRQVLILEKEEALARHQTGRNSGVLHSGIYYKPGSLKAVNCRAGKAAMEAFCADHGIPFEICGKVIVATQPGELPLLDRLMERGQANGVRCEMIGPERLREIEPHAAGLRAIHVAETGIVDYVAVCERLGALLREAGAELVFSARVQGMRVGGDEVALQTTAGDFLAERVVNCAGLYSDRIARLTTRPTVQIVPFRGEYFAIRPTAWHLCRHLIYPVPDPNFPFLGVHFTRMVRGGVECGPNAVLAFAREGYRKTDIRLGELIETLAYPGLWRIAMKYWRVELGEMWRSLSKRAFVHALQRLVPEVQAADLLPAPAGVRAQAVRPDGGLVDDFVIENSGRVVHVCNAPSPAATAAFSVGQKIVDSLENLIAEY